MFYLLFVCVYGKDASNKDCTVQISPRTTHIELTHLVYYSSLERASLVHLNLTYLYLYHTHKTHKCFEVRPQSR